MATPVNKNDLGEIILDELQHLIDGRTWGIKSLDEQINKFRQERDGLKREYDAYVNVKRVIEETLGKKSGTNGGNR